jgi:hypothetical protein
MYVNWFVLLARMSPLLTFPCHAVPSDYNEPTGSIPSELKELTSLIELTLCMWIGLFCSYECHTCSHFLAILSHQLIIMSRFQFRANSKNSCCWLCWGSVRLDWSILLACMSRLLAFPCHYIYTDRDQLTGSIPSKLAKFVVECAVTLYMDWFVLFAWMSPLVTFPCHSVPSDYNELMGSIQSKLNKLTSLTKLTLCTWIGFSCSYECHACSAHFLATLLFEQVIIN